MKNFKESVGAFIGISVVVILFSILVFGGTWLRWQAYKQRYPNAEFWTMFFQK